MTIDELKKKFASHPCVTALGENLGQDETARLHLTGFTGSGLSMVLYGVAEIRRGSHLIIAADREDAAYLYNDLVRLAGDRKVLFLPTSFRTPYLEEKINSADVLQRTETLDAITHRREVIVVTYPRAVAEKVISRKGLKEKTLDISEGEALSIDFINEMLFEYHFERVDFVTRPGEFAVRGGIVDIFSFNNDRPYRIEFFGDEVESIRSFDPASQLSEKSYKRISIVPDVRMTGKEEKRVGLLDFFTPGTAVWIKDIQLVIDKIKEEFEHATDRYANLDEEDALPPAALYQQPFEFDLSLTHKRVVTYGPVSFFTHPVRIEGRQSPQPVFHKNFELLIENLEENAKAGYKNIVAASSVTQIERLHTIFEDLEKERAFTPLLLDLHEGFIDHDLKLAVYTDHQIFERFHRFYLKEGFKDAQRQITLKELSKLEKGDYVTHVDHGVGKFAGLVKIENNGKMQEVIKLVYRDNDVLFVSIHSLHRIARYVGKDGTEPKVNKLGSPAWKNLKNKTKRKIKELAFDLIKLYAERKKAKGFAFSPDSYLQYELEASFIYEDTPDQEKATRDVKKDMESEAPMDRLVCGDVGFGKTEVAIRAAFKAAVDGKQVAILVPTTILAFQHYNTFKKRLKDFPVAVDYLNRFRTAKDVKRILNDLAEGKIDIIIGTHRLVGKDVTFNDLGLLIIDEEQKFGVAVKEKLKTIKKNVDTLTLTATPIPRTLQFSMMGARDMSVINTPPPNRQPVQTEIHPFNEVVFRDAISYELARGGQVFVVNDRVQNLEEVADFVRRGVPGARVVTAHGQLEGRELETRMMKFIRGEYDVLVATTIIESGLDITNANTIIINNAHHFGLSDLHQMRGRVGRSNRKAFCYLIAPPFSTLTNEARKRLQAIVQFSDLGSGINIAMRDLDIRGAGNILGAEQSGFIADIGFEMYQKILDEAITELKENEFKDLFKKDEDDYTRDTKFETDLELMLPDDYVNSVTERLELYKRLSAAGGRADLKSFVKELTDRFGPLPPEAQNLIQSMWIKWAAGALGIEKLVLKSNKMIGYFISGENTGYYNSDVFGKVLDYVRKNPGGAALKDRNGRLSIVFDQVTSLHQALKLLHAVNGTVQ